MTIGLDLSSLQGAHRMRGIGYTLINFINNISEPDRRKHNFIFYIYPESDDPLELLNLEGLVYEIRPLKHCFRVKKQLPGRLNLFVSAFNQLVQLKDLYIGDSRIKELSGVDFFLQSDQSQHLPRWKWRMKRGLIIYDIIPYVLEWEYLWSYKTARRHGFSRKAALRVKARRWLYGHKIRLNTRHADILFSISEHTKKDFVRYVGVSAKKIIVTPLGVNLPSGESGEGLNLKQYVKSSWGYMKRELKLDADIPFILYVGGADKRRKLQDLVTAFNHLRAEGHDLKLVLAGDSMQGYDSIATEEIQYALKTSSYKGDVVYMGFADDQTRDWLYHHALVFVFPSRYEGFGLPVLEAMSYGTPVISYDNDATKEVALTEPMYVNDAEGVYTAVLQLLESTKKDLAFISQRNKRHARKYSWNKTASFMVSRLEAKT